MLPGAGGRGGPLCPPPAAHSPPGSDHTLPQPGHSRSLFWSLPSPPEMIAPCHSLVTLVTLLVTHLVTLLVTPVTPCLVAGCPPPPQLLPSYIHRTLPGYSLSYTRTASFPPLPQAPALLALREDVQSALLDLLLAAASPATAPTTATHTHGSSSSGGGGGGTLALTASQPPGSSSSSSSGGPALSSSQLAPLLHLITSRSSAPDLRSRAELLLSLRLEALGAFPQGAREIQAWIWMLPYSGSGSRTGSSLDPAPAGQRLEGGKRGKKAEGGGDGGGGSSGTRAQGQEVEREAGLGGGGGGCSEAVVVFLTEALVLLSRRPHEPYELTRDALVRAGLQGQQVWGATVVHRYHVIIPSSTAVPYYY